MQRGFVLSLIFPTLPFFQRARHGDPAATGGYYTYLGVISAGAWFLFMNSVSLFWFPMINLSAFWSQFQGALSATERIFALIDAEPAVFQTADEPVEALTGDIQFEQVDFRYGSKEQVLSDFNLHIEPGESIALVGHTGAGKSSIAKLVTRFYEFQGGHCGSTAATSAALICAATGAGWASSASSRSCLPAASPTTSAMPYPS